MESPFDNLPIIPHEHVADVDCCGCLMVRVRKGQADIRKRLEIATARRLIRRWLPAAEQITAPFANRAA